MTSRRGDPATVFVRGLGTAEGLEWGVWLALTVFWIVELDLSPGQLVLLGVALEVAALISETPTGVVADVYSRRRSVVLAQLIMGIAFIWAFASTNFWVILPAQALIGFGWTFRTGADTAWVTDELKGGSAVDDDEIERLLLRRHRWGIALSLIVGPVTIALGWWQSVRWVGIAIGIVYILLGAWMAVAMTEEHFTPARDRDVGLLQTFQDGLNAIRVRPRLRVLVVVTFLFYLGADVFDRLGYVHFLDSAGLDDVSEGGESLLVLGILFFVLALGGLLVNRVAEHYLGSGKGVVRLAVTLLVVATLGGLIAAVTSLVVVIAIGYLFQDSVREALWPVLEGWANRDAPSEVRATVHSLLGQMTSVGQISGAAVLGLVAEASSIPLAMAIGAACFGLAATVAVRGIAPDASASDGPAIVKT